MSRRRAKQSGESAKQHKIAFDHGHAAVPPPMLLLGSSGDVSSENADALMSPTSILQTAAAASPTSPATCTAVPFSRNGSGGGSSCDRRSKSHRPWDAKPVGLGLVGELNGAAPDGGVTPTVLTGQKLRVQSSYAPCSPPPSREFGVKGGTGGAPALADPLVQVQRGPRRRCLSPREMEMSEDYTCVIARGPNPRTTHIFDDCVVESCGRFSPASGGDDFLRYCHSCTKDLGQGKDIFMYRGERAFCSRECRYREMLLFDDGAEEL